MPNFWFTLQIDLVERTAARANVNVSLEYFFRNFPMFHRRRKYRVFKIIIVIKPSEQYKQLQTVKKIVKSK